MRSPLDIQKAHDILHAVAAREIDVGLTENDRAKLHAVHDVLSWVLEGPCGGPFVQILNEIQREAQRRGYVLVDQGEVK